MLNILLPNCYQVDSFIPQVEYTANNKVWRLKNSYSMRGCFSFSFPNVFHNAHESNNCCPIFKWFTVLPQEYKYA